MKNKIEHYLADFDDLNPDEAFEDSLYADELIDAYEELNSDYINGKLTHIEYDYYATKLGEKFNEISSERYHLQFKNGKYPPDRIETPRWKPPEDKCWK